MAIFNERKFKDIFDYVRAYISFVKMLFFFSLYNTSFTAISVNCPSVAWNTSHLNAFYNSKLQFFTVIIYLQFKLNVFTKQITNFTHSSFPSRQATTITTARHPVTSSWDSASHAASLFTVISIMALRTNYQSKHNFFTGSWHFKLKYFCYIKWLTDRHIPKCSSVYRKIVCHRFFNRIISGRI